MKKEPKTTDVKQETPTPAQEVPTEEATTDTHELLVEENHRLQNDLEHAYAEIEKLKLQVEKLQGWADKCDTYLGQLVAMKNDFESYKRRMRVNSEQARQEGVVSVALKLIDIADTFDIAKQHLHDEETLKAFDMIYQQLLQTLLEYGIVAMDVKGKEFDHMTMNALSQMDYGEENKGKVVEVYKKGYKMEDKVVRYAEVIVGA